ncbi:hypothetical protein LINPERHAP1_LOCUS35364 [Linum perenne]
MTRSRSSPAEASPVEGRFSRGRRCWKTLRLQSCKQYGVDWTSWWKVNSRAEHSPVFDEDEESADSQLEAGKESF